jgi:hypothetical protein
MEGKTGPYLERDSGYHLIGDSTNAATAHWCHLLMTHMLDGENEHACDLVW